MEEQKTELKFKFSKDQEAMLNDGHMTILTEKGKEVTYSSVPFWYKKVEGEDEWTLIQDIESIPEEVRQMMLDVIEMDLYKLGFTEEIIKEAWVKAGYGMFMEDFESND